MSAPDKPKLRPGDREPVTFHALAQRADPDQTPGAVVGGDQSAYPQLPPASPWAAGPGPGVELPLGVSVDDLEPAPRCDVAVQHGREVRVCGLSCACGRLVRALDADFVDDATRFICAACHVEVLRIDRLRR